MTGQPPATGDPIEVPAGGAIIARTGCDGGILVLALGPDVPVDRATATAQDLHEQSGLKVIAVAGVAAVRAWHPHDGLPAPAAHPEGMLGSYRPVASTHGQWTLAGYDENGFACLDEKCPACTAQALIINEADTAECLTCAWREAATAPRPADGRTPGQVARLAYGAAVAKALGMEPPTAESTIDIGGPEGDPVFAAGWGAAAEAIAAPLRAENASLRGQLAEQGRQMNDLRDRHRALKLSAAGDEAELRDIHETLCAAYHREDLSEETSTVVDAMAAEWKRWKTALERIASTGSHYVDGQHASRAIAREALEGTT